MFEMFKTKGYVTSYRWQLFYDRVISLLVTVCMMFAMVPSGIANAGETSGDQEEFPFDIENFLYNVNSDDTIDFKGFTINATARSIPESIEGKPVVSIGASGSLENCSDLESITIPASVRTIGANAFDSCTQLTAINVAAGNEQYSSADGILYNKDKTTLIRCPLGKSGNIVIPDNVTHIESGAFSDCAGITGVTLPASVTSIGDNAFKGCTNLEMMILLSENITGINIGQNILEGTKIQNNSDNAVVYVLNEVYEDNQYDSLDINSELVKPLPGLKTVQSVSAIPENGNIQISWKEAETTDSQDTKADDRVTIDQKGEVRYTVERIKEGSDETKIFDPITECSYTDDTLQDAGSYSYKVTASCGYSISLQDAAGINISQEPSHPMYQDQYKCMQ